MTESIIATTYDLLTFHESGNDGIFDRCFEKVLAYFSLSLNESKTNKYRRWTYQFLRTTGYLDLIPGQGKWTLSPPALVQTADDRFVLLAGSKESELFQSLVDKKEFETRAPRLQDTDFMDGVFLFPEILTLRANSLRARKLASRMGVQISEQYQHAVFHRLPPLNPIIDSVLFSVGESSVFEAGSAKVFNLESREWIPYAGMYPDAPGLYRHDYKFSPPKYYLCATAHGSELGVYLIQDREWALVSFCAYFDTKIPVTYHIASKTIHVPKLGFAELRLPTLLERCLRSGTIMEPDLFHNGFSYRNIEPTNFWTLVSRIPIFQVEQK